MEKYQTPKHSLKNSILTQLKNATDYISGEQLSGNLHVSRTAVWKHIQELKKDGYVIDSVTNRGYKLQSSPDTISLVEVQSRLQVRVFGHKYCHYETLESTNTTAKKFAELGEPEGTVVVAEQQTHGKGRMGRQWASPKGRGIYFSLIIRPKIPVMQAPQLTLVVATVIAEAIREQYAVPATIKWPNDIVVNGKKLCGILVEMSSDMDQIHHAVIGIGVNANNTREELPEVVTQWTPTSLYLETGSPIDRAHFTVYVIEQLERAYEMYLMSGFRPFRSKWESMAYSIGNEITITMVGETIRGILLGIEDSGALVIEENGIKRTIHSGEIII